MLGSHSRAVPRRDNEAPALNGVLRQGSLRLPPDTPPGEYELVVEDTTEHVDPGHKLVACRLATEGAMETIVMIVQAPPAATDEEVEGE